MKKAHATSAILATLLIAAASLPFAFAQDAKESDVVARVGEETITEKDLAQAEADFAQELAQIPANQRRSVLIDVLVDMHLLAQAARDEGMDETPEFQDRVDFLETRALRNMYVEKQIVRDVGEEEIQAAYEEVKKEFKPQEEIHARHILVKTEEEARDVIRRLQEGADFAELARETSTDPAAAQGGDLGYVGRGRLVPAFEEAAFALQPGEFTKEPVQTQFGWHVIKLEEKRMSSPPPLEQVNEQIRTVVMRQNFEKLMSDLRSRIEVEIVGDASAGAQANPGQPAASGPGAAGEAPAAGEPPAQGEAPAQGAAPSGQTPGN